MAKSLKNKLTADERLSIELLSWIFESNAVLNVKPCSFAIVGRKKGANLGTFGASLGLFRCFINQIKNSLIKDQCERQCISIFYFKIKY